MNKDSRIGEYIIEFDIPGNLLNAGNYYIRLLLEKIGRNSYLEQII